MSEHEIRLDKKGGLDELVLNIEGHGCVFHLERMSDTGDWWFALYPPGTDKRYSVWFRAPLLMLQDGFMDKEHIYRATKESEADNG